MSDRGRVRAAAVIADLVGSRNLPDRAAAQEEVLSAWTAAHVQVCPAADAEGKTAAVAPWATVGDEFQAVYPDVETALRALLRVLLALEEPVRLRFGIGLGEVTSVGEGQDGPIQDGDAWWSARAAIDAGHERDPKAAAVEVRDAAGGVPPLAGASARLLEHLVGDMRPRERRIVRATLDGLFQKDIAEAEGISQSAVSQSLSRSGGRAVLDADRLLAGPDVPEADA